MALVLVIIALIFFVSITIWQLTENAPAGAPNPTWEQKQAVQRKEFRIDWFVGVTLAIVVMAFTTKTLFGIVFIQLGYMALAFYFGWFARSVYVFFYNLFRRFKK